MIMKTIRIIQKVAIAVGMIVAIAVADGVNVSTREAWAAFALAVIVLIMVVADNAYRENEAALRKLNKDLQEKINGCKKRTL